MTEVLEGLLKAVSTPLCKDCAYWESWDNDSTGACTKITDANHVGEAFERMAYLAPTTDAVVRLYTDEGFGCVHGKRRET